MAGMWGADVQQLRDLAKQFDSSAKKLEEFRSSLGSLVESSGSWHGPDAASFRSKWSSFHAPNLSSAAAALDTGATRLRLNADDQESTSLDDGGSVGFGGGSQPGGGSNGEGTWQEAVGDGIVNTWPHASNVLTVAGVGSSAVSLLDAASDAAQLANAANTAVPGWAAPIAGVKIPPGLSTASNALGALGVGISAADAVYDFATGDYVGGTLSTLSAVGGVMTLIPFPPVQAVGAVIGIGAGVANLVYDNWDAISDFGSSVIDGVGGFFNDLFG